MRSLVVLLLVVAAVAALFFTYKSLDKKSSSDLGPQARQTAPVEDTGPVDIATPADQQSRQVTQVEIDEGRRDADPVEAASDDYANSLSGRVINTDAAPIAGATVILTAQPLMGEAIAQAWFMGQELVTTTEQRREVRTDGEGRYTFRGIEPSPTYYLVAQHSDYSFTQESFVSVGAEGEYVGPDVVMSPGSTLHGQVTDTNGTPIQNAQVHLDSSYMLGEEIESPDRLTSATDLQGYYEIRNVSQGPRNVSVQSDGQANQILHNQMFKGLPDDRIQKNFKLEIGHPIGGRVVGPDGAGIPDAKVLAMNYGNNSSSRGQALSDEEGKFQIFDLRQGSYILLVSAKGYRPGRLNRVQVQDMNITVDMLEQASVSGIVVDDKSNAAITAYQASVRRVSPGGNTYEMTSVSEKISSADGSFELKGIDPGRFVVWVEATGYAPCHSEPFDVRASEGVQNVTVRMHAGGALRGRIVDSGGKGVAGARVSTHDSFYVEDNLSGLFGGLLASAATERSTRSGADGSFEVALLSPGEYTLRVTHPSHTREYVQNLSVGQGRATDVGGITLRSGGTVRGTVYDRAGKPLSRGYVHLRSDDPNSTYDTRTSDAGTFEFRAVRAGSYRLSASGYGPGSGNDPFTSLADETRSEVQITVTDGGQSTQDLNLGG